MSDKMDLKQFGREIVTKLLKGESGSLKVLKEQFEGSKIKKVEYTGHGFFIHFLIDPKKEKIKKENVEIGGICKINNNKEKYDLILFIRDGAIDFLEGYVIGEGKFPKKIDFYKFEALEDNNKKLNEDKELQ